MRLLKGAGGELDWQDNHGRVALTCAVVRGAVDATRRKRVQLLLAVGECMCGRAKECVSWRLGGLVG